jgi:hypothetical protein
MSKKLFWEILVITLIGIATLVGCSSLSDSTGIISSPSISVTPPPSTSYPIDIAGTVIIAKNEIENGFVQHDTNSPAKFQFWIVHLVIRNKGQSSITGGNGNDAWQILPSANTSLLTGWLKPTGGENSSIPPGQIGSLTFLFDLPVSLDPNNCQIEFTDSDNQISIGNLTYNEKPVNYYNWDTQSVLSSYISASQSVPTIAKNSIATWSHTGYVETTMQGYGAGSYSSITFQDGFALTFVGTVGGYSAPAIGDKVKVTYYYDSSLGGNVITRCQPIQ